jgi:hypothetical protein
MTSFVEQYRGWLGVITMVVIMLWMVQLYSTVKENWQQKKAAKQDEEDFEAFKQTVLKSLNSLSKGEKFLLAYALYHDQQVVYSYFPSPHARDLMHKGLLTASGTGSVTNYPFQIPDLCGNTCRIIKENFFPRAPRRIPFSTILCRL